MLSPKVGCPEETDPALWLPKAMPTQQPNLDGHAPDVGPGILLPSTDGETEA